MHRSVVLLGILWLSGLSGPGFAAEKRAAAEPIEVSADSLQVDERAQRATYTGNVVVHRGDLTINADRVLIQGSGKAVQRIVATGNPVRLRQADRRGDGQQLVYEPGQERITLSGNAHIRQESNELAGERITYLLREQRTEVTGKSGQRVKSIFYSSGDAALPGQGGQAGSSR
ncbi:lipopolysaccharide transport periplasmic protein LptA [Thermithiobacillus plumbiphilus]|uniref:Lipopolysaccharide export system protein LptA n=1 Tax=Thermithiobacillus plumbiphilus TaxID=1729899 RepID=A0ABU9D936_9PROT